MCQGLEFSVSTPQFLFCNSLHESIRTQKKIVSFFSPNTQPVYSIKWLIVTYVEKYKENTGLTGFSSLFSLVFINGEKVEFG